MTPSVRAISLRYSACSIRKSSGTCRDEARFLATTKATTTSSAFGRTMELSGRTFKIDIDAVLAEGERVVVLCTVSAERHGRYWESPEVHVWRVADDLAVEFCEYQGDEHTEDQFWS